VETQIVDYNFDQLREFFKELGWISSTEADEYLDLIAAVSARLRNMLCMYSDTSAPFMLGSHLGAGWKIVFLNLYSPSNSPTIG
jgi:hypothetical protein